MYTVADGDAPYLVGARLYGAQKTQDNRWAWKSLTRKADGSAIDTSGMQPVPWFAGMQVAVPPSFTADTGARAGAKGTITAAGAPVPPQPQPQPGPAKPNAPGPVPGVDVPIPQPGFDNQGVPYVPSPYVSGDDVPEEARIETEVGGEGEEDGTL